MFNMLGKKPIDVFATKNLLDISSFVTIAHYFYSVQAQHLTIWFGGVTLTKVY